MNHATDSPNTTTTTNTTVDCHLDPPKPIATSIPAATIAAADRSGKTYFNFDSPPPAKRSRRISSVNPVDFDLDCSNASTATSTATTDSSSTTDISTDVRASALDGGNSSTSAASITPSAAPKRRGRPPKAHSTPISPTQLRDMSETDVRYFQMRDKNNEASRRSRLNRKDREQQFSEEAAHLEDTNRKLVALERRLEAQCSRWKERVLQLATV